MRVLRTAAALGCLVLAGCGDIGSTPSSTSRTLPSKIQTAQANHEYPPSHMAVQHANGARPTAIDAVRRFATAYINWNAQTIASDMRALASRSIGQARAAVTLAATNTAQDYELRQGGIANSGSVQAIAPLNGSRNRYVVVTLERTTATNTTTYQGLHPAWHLALATVAQAGPGHWVVSGWQPEN